MEYRRRCNICGKIWCYTDKDISANTTKSIGSLASALAGIGSAFSGNMMTMHVAGSAMSRTQAPTDFEKCPSCNSTNTELMRDDGITPAAIEELKKYKELLDLGIITQDEFDEKKKAVLSKANDNNHKEEVVVASAPESFKTGAMNIPKRKR